MVLLLKQESGAPAAAVALGDMKAARTGVVETVEIQIAELVGAGTAAK